MHHEIVGGQLSLGDGTKLPLSKATRAGEFLFLSGQLALGDDGQLKGTDISTQTERCIENIRAVLAEVDGNLTNVIKATVWLVERRDFGSFNKIYAKHFPQNAPARSAVCSELMLPGALVEIEVVAYLPNPS